MDELGEALHGKRIRRGNRSRELRCFVAERDLGVSDRPGEDIMRSARFYDEIWMYHDQRTGNTAGQSRSSSDTRRGGE